MRNFIPRLFLTTTAMLTIGTAAAADVDKTPHQDPAADVTYVRVRPPAPLEEAGATTAADAQVWVQGHWAWQNGSFLWRNGYTVPKPTPTARWQQGGWERVVTRHHGWRYRPGRWLA